jgi:hypothetical protein
MVTFKFQLCLFCPLLLVRHRSFTPAAYQQRLALVEGGLPTKEEIKNKWRMSKINVRKEIFSFLSSLIVSFFLLTLLSKIAGDESNFFRLFLYLLIMMLPAVFLIAVIIYAVFFVMIKFIYSGGLTQSVALVISISLGILYYFSVQTITWHFAKNRFPSFNLFIKEPNMYLVFTIVSIIYILITSFVALIQSKKNKKNTTL